MKAMLFLSILHFMQGAIWGQVLDGSMIERCQLTFNTINSNSLRFIHDQIETRNTTLAEHVDPLDKEVKHQVLFFGQNSPTIKLVKEIITNKERIYICFTGCYRRRVVFRLDYLCGKWLESVSVKNVSSVKIESNFIFIGLVGD